MRYVISGVRVMLMCVSMVVVVGVRGQYSSAYYHRTGDTVMYDSPIYFHNWWGYEASIQQNRPYCFGSTYDYRTYGPAFESGQKLLS